MLNFVTINWRDYQGRGVEYTNCLYDSVTRNLKEGMPGRFIVFTDEPYTRGYTPGIEVRALPETDIRGWYNKNQLFMGNIVPDGDRIVYFDLDTVIVGSLDDIAAYDGDFAILRDFYRPNGLQSSVMLWEAGTCNYIWNQYAKAGCPEVFGGDQAWIEEVVSAPVILQAEFPHKFVSYKKDARFGIPVDSSVVVFHGNPRPHEAEGWVEKVWKVGGATCAQLELVGNTAMEAIRDNIQRAEVQDGIWLETVDPHDGVALICAGGPSLKQELASVCAHVTAGADVFACNNVPRSLSAFSIEADYHVMVDARPENLEFTTANVPTTICLYASQCDKAVHEAAGGNLVLWHAAFDGVIDIVGADKERLYVGGGTTCGMKAATLAWTLGYRTIHLYGFDSCYSGEDHHAYPQSLNDGEKVLDAEFNGKIYRCSPWMIQQAEDFEVFAPQLIDHGVEIHVHGTGLIPDIAAQFSKGKFRLEAADFRASAILERLEGVQSPKVAEIGVFAGDLSRRLLARSPDMNLLMIDSWAPAPKAEYAESEDFHASLSKEKQDAYFSMTVHVTDFARGRRTIMRMDSKDAANVIPDESLDLVFIDADHSYEGCRSDLRAWFSKVRPGGIVSGHDYGNDDWKFGPMVKRAVDEFASEHGLAIELGQNFTWFVQVPHEVAA